MTKRKYSIIKESICKINEKSHTTIYVKNYGYIITKNIIVNFESF